MSKQQNSNGSTGSSRKNNRPEPANQPAQETLQQILTRFDITNYDLLLVGDGSGNSWNNCCGWSAVMIEALTRDRWLFYGAMSVGSINLAEMLPYVQSLTWYHQDRGKARLHELGRMLQVHVITDSQVVASQGAVAADFNQPLPKYNSANWAAMRQFARLGYQIHYHHEGRSQTVLNWTADLLAGVSRRQLQGKSPSVVIAGEMLRKMELVATDCRIVARAYPDQEGSEQTLHLLRAAETLEELLRAWKAHPQRAAVSLDAVALRDPVTGAPINLQHLNPDQALIAGQDS